MFTNTSTNYNQRPLTGALGIYMEVINKQLDQITPYENNAKNHPPEQIEKIARSIEEFGFRTPVVVDSNGVLIQGHGRYQAAIKLKLETIPVIIADDLSDEKVKALRLADNAVSESSYDPIALHDELRSLESFLDFGFAGYSEDELDDIFADKSIFDKEEAEEEKKNEKTIPKMERMLNEHNDYVVFVFRSSLDYIRILEEFNIKKVDSSLSPKIKKIGLGRVIDGKKLLEVLDAKKDNH